MKKIIFWKNVFSDKEFYVSYYDKQCSSYFNENDTTEVMRATLQEKVHGFLLEDLPSKCLNTCSMYRILTRVSDKDVATIKSFLGDFVAIERF